VLTDSAYGSVTAFRRELDAMGMEWCLGIDSTLKVIDADEDLGEVGLQGAIGRPPVRPRKHHRAIRRVGERGRMGSRTAGFFSQSDLAAG
jgi:SRSO17 transposase